jgi:hypothetical protein
VLAKPLPSSKVAAPASSGPPEFVLRPGLWTTVVPTAPGVMVIVDLPDPNAAPAMTGVVAESGVLSHVNLIRLWTQDEIKHVRQKADDQGRHTGNENCDFISYAEPG